MTLTFQTNAAFSEVQMHRGKYYLTSYRKRKNLTGFLGVYFQQPTKGNRILTMKR